MNDRSMFVREGNSALRSRLVKSIETGIEALESYEDIPQGVWHTKAIIKCGDVNIKSDELDFEFTVPFDDNTEANEAEITIYNLTDTTIHKLKDCKTNKTQLSIEAGYENDTGVIFKGTITSIKTYYDDVDKVTELVCNDCAGTEILTSITYKENTKASTILKDLIKKLNMPIAVFKARRDYTYTDSVTVEGNLRENLKNYADVCGISVYANNGNIYARAINDGDNINFTVNDVTGLIASPEEFTEEVKGEDKIDTLYGYKITMLLQHRITTAAIINLTSKSIVGTFRVRSGEHNFTSDGEATTTFKAVGTISTRDAEKETTSSAKTATKQTSGKANKLMQVCQSLKGTKYAWGGNSPGKAMDCSHYVCYCFQHCGVANKVAGYATAQGLYNMSTKISASEVQVGDIAFFNNGSTNHVGIISSKGKMWNCYSGGGVGNTPISYGGKLVGYGRLWS